MEGLASSTFQAISVKAQERGLMGTAGVVVHALLERVSQSG